MSKRLTLEKKSVRTGVDSGVIVADSRKGVINPGLSSSAREQIQRFEESSRRAEQRLGMTRLA